MILPDTYPNNWACMICNDRGPHEHKVFNAKTRMWYAENHGYDIRYFTRAGEPIINPEIKSQK